MSRLFVENEIKFFDELLTDIENALRSLGLAIEAGQLNQLQADKNATATFVTLNQSATKLENAESQVICKMLFSLAYAINELKNLPNDASLAKNALTDLQNIPKKGDDHFATKISYNNHGTSAIREALACTVSNLTITVEHSTIQDTDKLDMIFSPLLKFFSRSFSSDSLSVSRILGWPAAKIINPIFESNKSKITLLSEKMLENASDPEDQEQFFDALDTFPEPESEPESTPEPESEPESTPDPIDKKRLDTWEEISNDLRKAQKDLESTDYATIEKKINTAEITLAGDSPLSATDYTKHRIALGILNYLKRAAKLKQERTQKSRLFVVKHKIEHGAPRAQTNKKVGRLLNLLTDNKSTEEALELNARKISSRLKGWGLVTRRSALKLEVLKQIGTLNRWC